MGDDGTFYKGVFLMVFAFGTGIGVGYKVMSTVFFLSNRNIYPAHNSLTGHLEMKEKECLILMVFMDIA